MVHLAEELIVDELAKRWQDDSDRINEICAYALQPPIKSLCPSLLLESARAVGGNPETLVLAALATKYLYVGLVVHDDILDGDDQRWGRASVPARYGTGDAVLAGDVLLLSIFSTLTECGAPAESVVGAVRALADAAIDISRGQAVEEDIRGDLQCGMERYTKVARLKTAAMFHGVCRAGAVLGGGDQEAVSRVTGYADRLGLAFQMYDDLLPYTGGSEALEISPKVTLRIDVLPFRSSSDTSSRTRSVANSSSSW